MTAQEQILIIEKEIIVPALFALKLYNNGIVEVAWDPKLEVIDASILKKLTESMGKISKGERMPVYVHTNAFMDLTQDAKEYAGTLAAQEFTLANAILVDNLAKKILYNFFIKFYGLSSPHKAFKSRETAFEWLLMLKAKQ
ncbi:MAG: hypothetical protein IPM77_06220 [Crocinitomicaceae bacterium]|nr:hypothetical protein [Crocinitomicaceae bacterium]